MGGKRQFCSSTRVQRACQVHVQSRKVSLQAPLLHSDACWALVSMPLEGHCPRCLSHHSDGLTHGHRAVWGLSGVNVCGDSGSWAKGWDTPTVQRLIVYMKELRSGGIGELDCLQRCGYQEIGIEKAGRRSIHIPAIRPFPPQVLRLSGGGVLFWNHMLIQVEWSGLKLHISNLQPPAPTLLASLPFKQWGPWSLSQQQLCRLRLSACACFCGFCSSHCQAYLLVSGWALLVTCISFYCLTMA